MFRLRYTVETTLAAVRESPGISLLTVVTIGAALLVLGGYVAGLQNLENLALTWGRSAALSAYLDDESSESEWQTALEQIRSLDEVEHATLLTPEEALAAFRAQGSEAAALVEGIQAQILPASIEIELKNSFADLTAVERVAAG
ncbi:MAG: permease-like cell division protein FtsX, partial [Myxococcota bacterium]